MSTVLEMLKERRRTSVRPFILGELIVVFLLLRVYDYVKSLESVRMVPAMHNGRDVLAAEEVLHLNIESTANHWAAAHHTFSTLMVWWYQYSHITGTMIVLACCYLFSPQIYRSARNSLVLTNCVGMLVFLVIPVMPPRLLPGGGFIDSVAVAGFGVDHGGPVEPAQFAAMPSLHLAWATWVAVVAFTMLRGTAKRGLVFIYPAITTIAVITTANHYVLDVIAGVTLTMATCSICGLVKHARASLFELPVEPARVAAFES